MSIQELQTLAEEIDGIANHAGTIFAHVLVIASSCFLGFFASEVKHACGKCIKHLTELIPNRKSNCK